MVDSFKHAGAATSKDMVVWLCDPGTGIQPTMIDFVIIL